MNTEHASRRTSALRALLVEAANSAPPRARIRPALVVAAIAAFALAGAGTGALSAAALAASKAPMSATDSVETSRLQAAGTEFLGEHNGSVIGAAYILVGQGQTTIDMGARPDGADSVTYAAECLSQVDVTFNIGAKNQTLPCNPSDPGEQAVGGVARVRVDAGNLKLHVVSTGGYAIWAAWSTGAPAPDPDPSAAQAAELADGVVTIDEYRAAFARFSACMTAGGWPLTYVDDPNLPHTFYYSPDNADGTHEAEVAAAQKLVLYCLPYEFSYVENMWQKAHPQ